MARPAFIDDPDKNREAVEKARKYMEEGASYWYLAQEFGFGQSRIALKKWMQKNGIDTPARTRAFRGKLSRRAEKPNKPKPGSWFDQAMHLRWEKKMSLREIAAIIGVSNPRICTMTSEDRIPEWRARQAEQANQRASDTRAVVAAKAQELKEKYQKPTEDNMPDRTWPIIASSDPMDTRNAALIKCCKCGATLRFKKAGAISHQHATRAFREKGWHIGGGPNADQCASCWAKIGKVEPKAEALFVKPPLEPAVASSAIGAPVTAPAATNPVQPTAAPKAPSEMQKADRRIVFNKLEDVYADDGYKDEWTDAKVAAELGCPIEWVAKIRDENFGPGINAAMARAEAIKKFKDQYTEITVLAAEIRGVHNDANTRMIALENKLAEIKKAIAALG